MNVEAEVSKFKNIKNRDELGMQIREYKNLAMQHSGDIFLAGQYDMVAHKLQEIYDKMPAPKLRAAAASKPGAKGVTANINKDEKAKINAAWKKRTGK